MSGSKILKELAEVLRVFLYTLSLTLGLVCWLLREAQKVLVTCSAMWSVGCHGNNGF